MRAVAPGGLAVAPDPVADQRQQERAEAQRLEGGRVNDEAGEESCAGTGHRAAQQRHSDDRDQQEIGDAAEDLDVREDGHLEDGRDKDEHRDLEAADHGLPDFLARTNMYCNPPKSTNGVISICLLK